MNPRKKKNQPEIPPHSSGRSLPPQIGGDNTGPGAQLVQHVRAQLAQFPQGTRFLVGVSGGLDSVALLHLLVALRGAGRFVVCHLNHQLRGRAAADDSRFVRALAKKLGCACECGRADVAALAKSRKLSLETSARAARHAFFFSCAAKFRCPRIILAHHGDDQAETVVLNLFRGSGLAGLGAMRAVSRMKSDDGRRVLTVIRPLLGILRSQLEEFAAQQGLRHRHDASNDAPDHLRNRIRHNLLPEISAAFQRDVRPALLRLAAICQDEDDFMTAQTQAAMPLTPELPAAALRLLAPAIQSRVVHAWLKFHRVPQIDAALVQSVRTLADPHSRQAKLNLPGGRHVRRSRGRLFVEG